MFAHAYVSVWHTKLALRAYADDAHTAHELSVCARDAHTALALCVCACLRTRTERCALIASAAASMIPSRGPMKACCNTAQCVATRGAAWTRHLSVPPRGVVSERQAPHEFIYRAHALTYSSAGARLSRHHEVCVCACACLSGARASACVPVCLCARVLVCAICMYVCACIALHMHVYACMHMYRSI